MRMNDSKPLYFTCFLTDLNGWSSIIKPKIAHRHKVQHAEGRTET